MSDPLYFRLLQFTREITEHEGYSKLIQYLDKGQFKQEYTDEPYTDCTAEILYKDEDGEGIIFSLTTIILILLLEN